MAQQAPFGTPTSARLTASGFAGWSKLLSQDHPLSSTTEMIPQNPLLFLRVPLHLFFAEFLALRVWQPRQVSPRFALPQILQVSINLACASDFSTNASQVILPRAASRAVQIFFPRRRTSPVVNPFGILPLASYHRRVRPESASVLLLGLDRFIREINHSLNMSKSKLFAWQLLPKHLGYQQPEVFRTSVELIALIKNQQQTLR